jgi:uncharacterized protein (TIGR02246 family)
MKMRSAVALAGLAIGFAAPTVAQQREAIDPKTYQQIREFCTKFDETFNTNNAAAIAALYTEDGIHVTGNGTFHGQQAIEKDYAKHAFGTYHAHDYYTSISRVTNPGNEVHLFGTWSCAFKDDAFTKHIEGHYLWILIRDGDNWKIRKDDSHEVSRPW